MPELFGPPYRRRYVAVHVQNVAVVRTVTHSAFGGLISSRDFVDLIVNETTPDFISTSGQSASYNSFAIRPIFAFTYRVARKSKPLPNYQKIVLNRIKVFQLD